MTNLEFVKEKVNAANIATASRQQKQIKYFIESSVQEEITQAYINAWAHRKYKTDDYFLTWIKNIFRTPNFLSFFKYLRHPLPSAKLINDEIVPMLKRVYHAEDSYFEYALRGDLYESLPEIEKDNFENELFNAVIFRPNDIIIHDLKDINEPYRFILSIDNVVSVKSHKSKIKRICYTGEIETENGKVQGYAYIDSDVYAFYDKDYRLVLEVAHDLKECPAVWISNDAFSTDSDIIRKSIFSYVREELEEYVFLKTLRKMSEPNGAIPMTVKFKGSNQKDKSGRDTNRESDVAPMAANTIGSQAATAQSEVAPSDSLLQTGTVIDVPFRQKQDGSIDTDLVQSFMKMYYIPVECLNYIEERIVAMERSIIANALGDVNQSNDSAKNEDQVFYSMNNKQDKLRSLAMNLTWTRTHTDTYFLALKYGIDAIKVNIFYGSDFFLDTEAELLDRLPKAPNQIERRNILRRLNQVRNRFNPQKKDRVDLLYKLIPFTTDKDFESAISNQIATPNQIKLQLQFDYFITKFEATYGDILQFYISLTFEDSQKLIFINQLLTNLINENNE